MLDFFVNRSVYPAATLQHRIALVTASYDRNIDGVALTLNRLVAHLVRRGHEVLVFTPAPRRARGGNNQSLHAGQRLRDAGAPIVRVPALPCPIWSEYQLTWGLGRAATARLEAFAPTVVHVAIQDPMGHAAQRWAHRRGVPVVCSHHTRFERYLGYYGLSALERLFWFGMRRFHGRCAATMPPSESLAQVLVRQGVPRVKAWHRGVDTHMYRPGARSEVWRGRVGSSYADAPDAPIVLIVARLRWEKGLRGFAEVIAELVARGVPHRVAVVGDGPARAGLASLLPPSSAFFGTLTGEDLAAAYASSDIFLFPSTTEGWGGTCLEAQAAGLPVVATRSSGIVEVLADAIGGYLLPPGNVSALADAVAHLATDDAERHAMGRRAVSHAARFDWAASGDSMLCEYDKHAPAVPPRLDELGGRALDSPERPAQPQPTAHACRPTIEIVDVPAPIRRSSTVARA